MIEYANESVTRAIKQYDMLSRSLKFTTDQKQKQDICYQMTRIIENILQMTNTIYEEKYTKIASRSTYLMDEEKNRLLELINLINERRAYINNQVTSNLELTGISLDSIGILGLDKIEEYKEQVKIIEKYQNNIKQDRILKEEIASLDISIKKANSKINTNKNLNRQLESRMISILEKAFKKLALYELQEREKEINLAYTELGYSLEQAKENAKVARKDCTPEIILECDNLLASTTLEYERYKEKKLILKLIEIYKTPVNDYEELLKKREEINTILSGIVSSELYLEVGNELNKQYATIKLEQQDVATLESLIEEKDNKTRQLENINKENNSEQFKGILATLLENEKKYQEQLIQEKNRQEEERRAKEIEEEKRKQQEIVRRQKALEEERKKEIEERTKQLLVEKKNPILFGTKEEKSNPTNQNSSNTSASKKEFKANKPSAPTKATERSFKEPIPTTPIQSRSNRLENNSRIDIKPSEDIFSRERKNTRMVDEGIPVIKNNKLDNNVIAVKEEPKKENVFPKLQLNKEEDIFPKLPDMEAKDSFFNQEEFNDLNKFMEDDNKNSWF